MAAAKTNELDTFMEGLKRRNPHEDEFHQAVYEVAANVFPHVSAELDTDFPRNQLGLFSPIDALSVRELFGEVTTAVASL